MTIREQIDRILAARKEKGKELEARLEAWKKLKESLYRGTSSLVMESMDIKDDKLREQYGRIFNDVDASEVELLKLMDQVVAAMGDGDLGLTMSKGYGALPGFLRETAAEGEIGKQLMKAGMKMQNEVPSTMGTLMSSGIMQAGKAFKGKTELVPADLATYVAAFAEGIQKRGKCQLGTARSSTPSTRAPRRPPRLSRPTPTPPSPRSLPPPLTARTRAARLPRTCCPSSARPPFTRQRPRASWTRARSLATTCCSA